MAMKVYIEGASGFIGTHVKRMLDERYVVTEDYYEQDTKWIINCGGLTNPRAHRKYLYESNVVRPMQLWDTMPKGCRLLHLDTTDPTVNPYSRSKAAARELLTGANNVTVLRLGTVYGHGANPNSFIMSVMNAIQCAAPIKIYCDGSSTRAFTCVSDVVRAVRYAIECHKGVAPRRELVGGDVHSLIDAANLIGRIMQCVAPSMRILGEQRPSYIGDPQDYRTPLYSGIAAILR